MKLNRKKLIGLFGIIIAIAVVILIFAAPPRIHKIGGYKINTPEYELLKLKNEAGITTYFAEKYSVNIDKDFWNRSFDGESPKAMLDDIILREYKTATLLFTLGNKYELIVFDNFNGFFGDFKSENIRREKALAAGQPIYGPKQYLAADYLDYMLNNLIIQLPPLMEGNELVIAESDIEKFYEENKDELFATVAAVTLDVLELPTTLDETSLENEIASIQSEIAGGVGFKTLMKKYNSDGQPRTVEIKDNSITSSRYPALYGIGMDAQQGDIIGPIEIDGVTFFISCVEKKTGGIVDFTEYYADVKNKYLTAEFEKYLLNHVDAMEPNA